MFTDRLHNVGNPPIFQYHQELLNLQILISRMASPLYRIKFDYNDTDPDDLEHLRHLSFKETEGSRIVEEKKQENIGVYYKGVRLWKINIGSEDKPKMASIGYYLDDQTISEVVTPLKEYEDLFP